MRTLLLTRGAPGSGKSTWVEKNGLRDYALSPDDLRIMCSSLQMHLDGSRSMPREQSVEKAVWKVMFELLEHRMSRGEFTVVDATASGKKDLKRYKDLADRYRYRVYVVDFTGVPLDVCLQRNSCRPEPKRVPEEAVRGIYSRLAAQKVPSGMKVVSPRTQYTPASPDWLSECLERPIDLSGYSKVVFVGDIHGCYDTLMQYPDFREGLKDDVEYVFLGDFIDRGAHNAEVLSFIEGIMDKPNVCILEGNHERWLQRYGNGDPTPSKEFESHTRRELQAKGFGEGRARAIYRKCRQMTHFKFDGIEVLACHGGVPTSDGLTFVPARDFIHGVGGYGDEEAVGEAWMRLTSPKEFLVHGHRNLKGAETAEFERVFNLEGQVERGGCLRILELSHGPEWKAVCLDSAQSDIYDGTGEEGERPIDALRANPLVNEKRLANGVSSFNFSREAFFERNWNRQTILARGLFLDSETGDVVARSYEKFFRIGEIESTSLESLGRSLSFPLDAYVKENGYLGILSYIPSKDSLFAASKSTDGGPFAERFRELLRPYEERLREHFRKTWKDFPHSLVFEVIDVENDPHIIEYGKSGVVLLDCIANSLDFRKLPYDELKGIASEVGVPVKRHAFTIDNYVQLSNFVDDCNTYGYRFEGKRVEGFVFEDRKGFMVKQKTKYYDEWKRLRSVADQALRCGLFPKPKTPSSPLGKLEELFYEFLARLRGSCYNKVTRSYPFPVDIISLRKRFFAECRDEIGQVCPEAIDGPASLLLSDCYGESERRLAPMLGRLNEDGIYLRGPIMSAGAWFLYLGGLGRKAVVDCLADEGVAPYMMTEALGKGAIDEMTALLKGSPTP